MARAWEIVAAAGFAAFATSAAAQLAVSAHDGKQLRPDDIIEGVTPDEIEIFDLNQYPPRRLGRIEAPASMIGPPSAVAVAPDESIALVTAAQRPGANGSGSLVPADIVTVVDLADPMLPTVRQTVLAGPGASGVAINPDQSLALVASTEDDGVTIFSIDQGRLSNVGRVQLPTGARPTDVRFTPDGRQALVVRRGDHRITVLDVVGSAVSNSGVDITPGRGPYQVAITPDGRFAITNNLGGAATRAEIDSQTADSEERPRPPGTVSVIDLHSKAVVQSIEVGATPETVTLSPDGKYLSVVVANSASVQQRAPTYNDVLGLLRVYRVEGGNLRPIAVLENGHWCQGATFSNDSKTLLVQCGSERAIEVYRLDGDNVTADLRARIETRSRGGSIATASSG